MSYDLFFEAGSGKKFDKKAFAAYFKGRANYKVAKGQALYQNEDTGVYFIVDEPADGSTAVNINLYRPHVFGLEAAIELEAFGKASGMIVVDPQAESPEGPFSQERFIKSWNAVNRFAYQSMATEGEPDFTWPAKRIRTVWEWNYHRAAENQRLGEDVFVPGIFAINAGGEVKSVAVWPPECPVMMPEVDAVLVPCEQKGKRSEKMAVVPWKEIHPVLAPYREKKEKGLPRYRMVFEEWPKEVAGFLGAKRKAAEIEGVPLDQVLDRELAEAARGK